MPLRPLIIAAALVALRKLRVHLAAAGLLG